MDKQPEALRLADVFDAFDIPLDREAAAELRRLHQVNQELVEVAEMAAGISIHTLPDRMKCRCSQCDMVNLARSILAKHKEKQNETI